MYRQSPLPHRAGAARELHQHRLGEVVGVVPCCDNGRLRAFRHPPQKRIPALARRRLHPGGRFQHLHALHESGTPEPVGERLHQRRIGVRRRAAQPVIGVGDDQIEPERVQQPEQHHRIHPATHGDDDPVAFFPQSPFGGEPVESPGQIGGIHRPAV